MEPTPILDSLVKAIRDAVATNQRHDDVALPLYNPEKNDNGADAWCRSIEKLGSELKWSSIQQAAKAGKALRGSALLWFETWEPETERSWEALRKDICDLYPEKKNISERLSKAVMFTSDSADTYCEYAREKIRLLRSTKVAFTESQLVELVCGSISDVSVRISSLNSTVGSTQELITLLSSYEKIPRKRQLENVAQSVSTNNAKRFKTNNESLRDEKMCFVCGKNGHLMARCPKNMPQSGAKESVIDNNHTAKTICSFCKKVGHTFEKCFHRVACTVCKKMGHSHDKCFQRFQLRNQDKNVNNTESK
jgi:hypothetical protein